MQRLNDLTACCTRADRHAKVAAALCAAGDEWAAVPYFYSAYHIARAALISDPIFNDPQALAAKSPLLKPGDRFTSRHHGPSKPTKVFGVNELVGLVLGSTASISYEMLHQASIQVRYLNGFTGDLQHVADAHDAFTTLIRPRVASRI